MDVGVPEWAYQTVVAFLTGWLLRIWLLWRSEIKKLVEELRESHKNEKEADKRVAAVWEELARNAMEKADAKETPEGN